MGTLAVLLTFLCLAFATLLIHATPISDPDLNLVDRIPKGKAYLYKYNAEVSAGQNEPAPYVSKFQIQGKLIQKQYENDGNSQFIKYLKFQDVKFTVYNGPKTDKMDVEYQDLNDTLKNFEEPILVLYDAQPTINKNQSQLKLQGIKMQMKEATWSKNMKKSLASTMQIDTRVELRENMQPITFQTNEQTIHGDCGVDYSVFTQVREGQLLYYVRKVYEPRRCTNYVKSIANDARSMHCGVNEEEDLVTSAERTYEFELIGGNDFLLKKIMANEKLNYLPWLHRSSGIQYIETRQIFELEKVVDESELKLPNVDFNNIPVTCGVTFDNNDYVSSGYERFFERRTIESNDLIAKVKELLATMVDYLQHPDYKNVVAELYQGIKYLDADSMHRIYNDFKADSEKDITARKIFLETVSHAGTMSAWRFTKDIIQQKKIPDETIALDMLANLPMYVIEPNEEFVSHMIGFQGLENATKSIKMSGILTYSILIHKTYKNYTDNVPKILEKFLEYYNERIKNEPTYDSKIVYIMVMKNIEVGNIQKYLTPIIRGEYDFLKNEDAEKSEKYRLAAMWAVAKSISNDRDKTYNLFWPILSDNTQSLPLRLTAYELLISRNPILDMNLLMNLHWIMMKEPDEHMFNYHQTTMKNMAESTNPCAASITEMTRKILRLTKNRKIYGDVISHANIVDYFDTQYGHGKVFKLGVGIEEASGFPQIGYYEEISIIRRKPMLTDGIYWNIDGINIDAIKRFMAKLIDKDAKDTVIGTSFEINDKKVKNLLRQTHGHALLKEKIHAEFWKMTKGYVTNVHVYSENSLLELFRDSKEKYVPNNLIDVVESFNFNWLDISYDNRYKMNVATDIGIPAVFYNEAPQLTFLKLNTNVYLFKVLINMKLELESKFHQQNSYKMEFYNPFADVTHSVQRHATMEAVFPMDMTVSFNFVTDNLKMVLPRTPETKFSDAIYKMQSIDQVKIGNDFMIYNELLSNYCPTCHHIVDITKDGINETKYENVYSADTGLEYTLAITDCEIIDSSNIEQEELSRVFNTVKNNADEDIQSHIILMVHQRLFNLMYAPYRNTCKKIFKISPSTTHPTSHIEMNWRSNLEKYAAKTKFDVYGSIDIKSASTNETMLNWNVDMSINLSKTRNHLKVQLTRKKPTEKNLKVCLEAEKEYPDFSENTSLKQETNTAIYFTMGNTNGEQCTSDDMSVKMTIKGELSDEQIEEMKGKVESGSCFKDLLNPLDIDIKQRFDWNCLDRVIKSTTLRKYTIDVTYKKIPHEVLAELAALDDYLRLDNLLYINYQADHTEPGNMKVLLNYSASSNHANVTIMNPFYSYKLQNVRCGSKNNEDRSSDLVLDNTRFSTRFLVAYYGGEIRPCVAHANDMITDMNQTIPMDFKNWTLMSGDHDLLSYAVFVKNALGNKLAVKIYFGPHVLLIQPLTDTNYFVMMDGVEILGYTKFENDYLRLSLINNLLSVETLRLSKVMVYYTPDNVVILPHIHFVYTNIDGMCGHMGSKAYAQQNLIIHDSS